MTRIDYVSGVYFEVDWYGIEAVVEVEVEFECNKCTDVTVYIHYTVLSWLKQNPLSAWDID